MKTRTGALIYDAERNRMDIRFGLEDYYGGLHCGTTMDVKIRGRWVPTRIELSANWYLVGIPETNLTGLIVRIDTY